jgi:membrane protease YdiL (CAAX protease family)
VDYFHGRFAFGWSYGLEAFAEGILYGGIRAKTGSVLPGAITHGLLDTFARFPKLFLNI